MLKKRERSRFIAGSAFFCYNQFIILEEKMNFRKLFLLFFVLIFILSMLFAEEENEPDFKNSTSLKLAISSLPEAKLTLSQSFTVPFLQGNNFLVSGNNIRFNMDAEITPICMGLLGSAIFTPIAFLEFSVGGKAGSGWNVEGLGTGIGLNVPDYNITEDENKTSVDGSAFDGTFLNVNFGAAFQFDIGAVVPGDWTHVLIRTYHEAANNVYSRADRNQPWFYESDHGENQNGWTYYSAYILGYQLPIFMNMVALQAEMYKYLFNYPDSAGWGGNIGRWDFSFIMNFKIIEKFSALLVTQFRLYRDYEDFEYPVSVFGKKSGALNYERYYQDRVYQDSRSLKFYRVAAILNYKLK